MATGIAVDSGTRQNGFNSRANALGFEVRDLFGDFLCPGAQGCGCDVGFTAIGRKCVSASGLAVLQCLGSIWYQRHKVRPWRFSWSSLAVINLERCSIDILGPKPYKLGDPLASGEEMQAKYSTLERIQVADRLPIQAQFICREGAFGGAVLTLVRFGVHCRVVNDLEEPEMLWNTRSRAPRSCYLEGCPNVAPKLVCGAAFAVQGKPPHHVGYLHARHLVGR